MLYHNRLKYILLVLFIYILAQLAWWAFLISKLTEIVYTNDPRLNLKITMVWGEGLVFAIILLVGFLFTYKAYLKEVSIARQQRNFLMSVTHEFKTPIASLSLFLETIKNHHLPEEKKMQLIASALKDTNRLNTLAENILLAARIDNNAFPLVKEKQNVSELTARICQDIIAHHGNDYRFELFIEDSIVFFVDRFAWETILNNLIENAMKYSPLNSKIQISFFTKNNEVILEIVDEGEGIPIESRKIVFNKFIRLQNEETRKTKGTGIGLYLVQHFVNEHQGTIAIETNSPQGTKFVLKFSAKG